MLHHRRLARLAVFRLSGFPAGTRKPDRLNNRDIQPDGLPSIAGF